jgi:hypothetical protein
LGGFFHSENRRRVAARDGMRESILGGRGMAADETFNENLYRESLREDVAN